MPEWLLGLFTNQMGSPAKVRIFLVSCDFFCDVDRSQTKNVVFSFAKMDLDKIYRLHRGRLEQLLYFAKQHVDKHHVFVKRMIKELRKTFVGSRMEIPFDEKTYYTTEDTEHFTIIVTEYLQCGIFVKGDKWEGLSLHTLDVPLRNEVQLLLKLQSTPFITEV